MERSTNPAEVQSALLDERSWRRSFLWRQTLMVLNTIFLQPLRLAVQGKPYARMLRTRFGAFPGGSEFRGGLWIHAPGIGEYPTAAALVAALPPSLPVVVTTNYGGGRRLPNAHTAFGERALVTFLPVFSHFAVRRFVRHFAPRVLVQVEAKPWSLVCRHLMVPRIPAVVINVFIGERHLATLRHPLLRPLLPSVDRFGVQSEAEVEVLLGLGIPRERIAVTGSLKFDVTDPAPKPEAESLLVQLADGRPILVAGSVHPPEVEAVLEAFEWAGGGDRALLLLAPRQIVWAADMEAAARALGHRTLRRSSPWTDGRPSVLILDTEGELAALYRVAGAAFIGGSLFPWGGHNPLEAARFGVPVAVGPSTEHLEAVARPFDQAGAWRRVRNASELAAAWREWLDEPERGREIGLRGAGLLSQNRGAVERTLELIRPYLTEVGDRGEKGLAG